MPPLPNGAAGIHIAPFEFDDSNLFDQTPINYGSNALSEDPGTVGGVGKGSVGVVSQQPSLADAEAKNPTPHIDSTGNDDEWLEDLLDRDVPL